jgi:PadR family transcriptional regulator PadR
MIFQVGAALLDACVLSALRREDAYGYVLTQTLMGTLEISESTLYPVLRRLQKDEFLSIYDRPHMGRNRRYYRITSKGLHQADLYREGWREYKSRVDSLILAEEDAARAGDGAESIATENGAAQIGAHDVAGEGEDAMAFDGGFAHEDKGGPRS